MLLHNCQFLYNFSHSDHDSPTNKGYTNQTGPPCSDICFNNWFLSHALSKEVKMKGS